MNNKPLVVVNNACQSVMLPVWSVKWLVSLALIVLAGKFTAMTILHFDLQPQFKYMDYFIYSSHHFTPHGRYELNKLTSLPMCGFIAQVVEHRTGIRGGHGFESRWSLDFLRLLLSNCLNWKIYCDDHSSLWSTTAVQIYELFHIYFTSKLKTVTKLFASLSRLLVLISLL